MSTLLAPFRRHRQDGAVVAPPRLHTPHDAAIATIAPTHSERRAAKRLAYAAAREARAARPGVRGWRRPGGSGHHRAGVRAVAVLRRVGHPHRRGPVGQAPADRGHRVRRPDHVVSVPAHPEPLGVRPGPPRLGEIHPGAADREHLRRVRDHPADPVGPETGLPGPGARPGRPSHRDRPRTRARQPPGPRAHWPWSCTACRRTPAAGWRPSRWGGR